MSGSLVRLSFLSAVGALVLSVSALVAQPYASKPLAQDKFRQLEEILPTPNGYRTASGAPGHEYWQQRANYVIDVTLDDSARTIRGKGEITYINHSPDTLDYLWLQLDASVFDKCS
ncbi:MAG: hypothetical protein ABW223_08785, partial [Rariglobus sp.]